MELRYLFMNALFLLCSSLHSQSHQDCIDPYAICELTQYQFANVAGRGEYKDILQEVRCNPNKKFKEANSKWLFFEIRKSGALGIKMEALKEGDEIEFVLFRMEDDCSELEEVSCRMFGNEFVEKGEIGINGMGDGIKKSEPEESQKPTISDEGEAIINILEVYEDEKYVLMVNNKDSGIGFSISFNGDCYLRNADGCKVGE